MSLVGNTAMRGELEGPLLSHHRASPGPSSGASLDGCTAARGEGPLLSCHKQLGISARACGISTLPFQVCYT